MSLDRSLLDTLQVTSEQGKWYVVVPWDHADELHRLLRRAGAQSTLCVDPVLREARLELWRGVDPQQALASLRKLGGDDPTPQAA
jgi:hypothetical protein